MNWNHLAQIETRGHQIIIKDAMILLDDAEIESEWPTVVVDLGVYDIEINVPEQWYCARVRIRSVGSHPELGKMIGYLLVDNSSVAILDYEMFIAEISSSYPDYEEWTEMTLFDEISENFSGQIAYRSSLLVYVKSGNGDGTYPVYELVENGKVVGLECHFEDAA